MTVEYCIEHHKLRALVCTVCHEEYVRERIAALEKELSEAKFQANFNAGYITTLKKLGLPERFLEEYQLQKMKIRELEKELVAANHATELERNGYHQDRLTWNQCEERRTAAKSRPLEDALNVAESKLKEAETREAQLREALTEYASEKNWSCANCLQVDCNGDHDSIVWIHYGTKGPDVAARALNKEAALSEPSLPQSKKKL